MDKTIYIKDISFWNHKWIDFKLDMWTVSNTIVEYELTLSIYNNEDEDEYIWEFTCIATVEWFCNWEDMDWSELLSIKCNYDNQYIKDTVLEFLDSNADYYYNNTVMSEYFLTS